MTSMSFPSFPDLNVSTARYQRRMTFLPLLLHARRFVDSFHFVNPGGKVVKMALTPLCFLNDNRGNFDLVCIVSLQCGQIQA